MFFIILEERSCARTVRRLLAEGMKVPCQMPGRDLTWTAPTIGSVRRILINPSYCGDYVYRRRIGDPTIADAVCDRLLHNAHRVVLKGPSRRKKEEDTTTN